jgi:hypothetical protein
MKIISMMRSVISAEVATNAILDACRDNEQRLPVKSTRLLDGKHPGAIYEARDASLLVAFKKSPYGGWHACLYDSEKGPIAVAICDEFDI